MTGEVGSYRYMAPELVRHEPYNAKADIYSWAILSWEVLAVSRPYAGITETSFIKVRARRQTMWNRCDPLASAKRRAPKLSNTVRYMEGC